MKKLQAIELIRASSLAQHAELLIAQLLPSALIRVHQSPPDGSSKVSRFGGFPSLVSGQDWPRWDKRPILESDISRFEQRVKENPRATGLHDILKRKRQELLAGPGSAPLLFLAQLCLAEIHAAVELPGWPSAGTLLFFYDPESWGFDPATRGHSRVLYHPPHVQLAKASPPDDLASEYQFQDRAVSFQAEWTLPSYFQANDVEFSFMHDEEYAELSRQLAPSLHDDQVKHRCGGHAQEIQGKMQLECQLVTNGIYCGDSSGYKDPRRVELEPGASDWQLLLQVDSDGKQMGWMWGDVGRIYFWARHQEIAASDFDGSWGILQCY